MKNKIYCGQCGAENPATNKFCGHCGNKLDYSITTPPTTIEYEYRSFKWRVPTDKKPDCVFAREPSLPSSDVSWTLKKMTKPQAREHFWQKYQKDILVSFQKWKDAGWQPITEVGPSCIDLEAASNQKSSVVLGFLKAVLNEEWCFAGATIKVRRPISDY